MTYLCGVCERWVSGPHRRTEPKPGPPLVVLDGPVPQPEKPRHRGVPGTVIGEAA